MNPKAVLITLALALTAQFAALIPSNAAAQEFVLPLDLSGTRPAVSISVGGRAPELWVFDTGAAGTVVEIERARAWGLPEQGEARIGSPIGGEAPHGFRTTLAEARIGDIVLPDTSAVAMPLHAQLQRAGVLSPNVFRGRLVQFDFAKAQARVLERTAANMPHSEATAYDGAHPLPAVTLHLPNGETISAHIDSGAPRGILLPLALADRLPLAGALEQRGTVRFVDGARPIHLGQLVGEVRFGPVTLINPQVEFVQDLPYGNIGMALLSNMIVTLDPERRVAWIERAPSE